MHLAFFRRSHEQVEKLYAELASPLLAYARSLGSDHATAEDVVQRTFLMLLNADRQPSEPRPYLFRTVRNAFLNHVRDRSRDIEISGDEPWFENETVDRTAELDLRRALTQLAEDQREVLMLHVWGGLSFQETGDALGISPNTAASRYRYALNALKRLLTAPALEEQ